MTPDGFTTPESGKPSVPANPRRSARHWLIWIVVCACIGLLLERTFTSHTVASSPETASLRVTVPGITLYAASGPPAKIQRVADNWYLATAAVGMGIGIAVGIALAAFLPRRGRAHA